MPSSLKPFSLIYPLMFLAFVFILRISPAFASEVAPEGLGFGLDLTVTLYLLFGGAILAIVTWISAKIVKLIDAKVESTWLQQTLLKLNTIVLDQVKASHAVLQRELAEARSPDSPGGERITSDEIEKIRDHVWQNLKSEFGGSAGIEKSLRLIGLGDAKKLVNAKIEAVLSDVEREERALNPTKPAQ